VRLITLVLAYAAFAPIASADIHIVPTQYPTIQAAADAASNGDEIHILPGTYDGFDVFVDVTIKGTGKASGDVTINGQVRTYESAQISNLRLTGGWNGNGSIKGDSMTDCRISSLGVFHELGPVTFTRCEFSDCQNGALNLTLGYYLVEDCSFINNTTTDSGGAIFADDSVLFINNSQFINNHADIRGGAVETSSSAFDLVVTESDFIGNTSGSTGGAIYFRPSSAGECYIESCLFEDNASMGNAGAVFIQTVNPDNVPGHLTGCNFRNNSSADIPASAALWFGIWDIQPDPTVGYTNFCGNTPADIYGEYTNIRDNTFRKFCQCFADVNGDGALTPADLTAWVNAFTNNLPECDQNHDGSCTPTDFTAWIANFNAGCD
jgi:predicted outer membrane repeat protein